MIEGQTCEVCGKPAKRFLFAAFLCDDEACIEKARERRGGPGGHQRRKAGEVSKVNVRGRSHPDQ